jgi:nucleotide-binding universal stress UspA family protein
MSIVKILAPLTGGPRDEVVLAGAFAAARPFNAHVEALFVKPDPVEAMPFYGEGMSSAVVQEIMDASKSAVGKASQSASAALAVAAQGCGAKVVASPEQRDCVTGSFVEVQGNFADCVTLAARLSDLVVFGSLKEGDRPGLSEAFEATLIETGRPIFLISQPPKPDFYKSIAVGWNGSMASAHAVTASLPFLKLASNVEILTVKQPSSEPISVEELKAYLKLRGIKASERQIEGGSRAVGDVLVEAAGKGGAGMLVAGGYGHSRLRELFVTGVTRRVVAQADFPCFLVH